MSYFIADFGRVVKLTKPEKDTNGVTNIVRRYDSYNNPINPMGVRGSSTEIQMLERLSSGKNKPLLNINLSPSKETRPTLKRFNVGVIKRKNGNTITNQEQLMTVDQITNNKPMRDWMKEDRATKSKVPPRTNKYRRIAKSTNRQKRQQQLPQTIPVVTLPPTNKTSQQIPTQSVKPIDPIQQKQKQTTTSQPTQKIQTSTKKTPKLSRKNMLLLGGGLAGVGLTSAALYAYNKRKNKNNK